MNQPNRLSDTPVRPKANQSSNYFRKLAKARPTVMDNLGSTIPMITFEQMLSHVLPQLDLDFQATMNNLVHAGHLEQVQATYKWSAFPTLLKSMHGTEPIVFAKIKAIQDAIVANAVFSSGPTPQTAEYASNPASRMESVRIENGGKPDGYGRLQFNQEQYVDPGWMCVAWAEEYKKSDAEKDRYDVSYSVFRRVLHSLYPVEWCKSGLEFASHAP